MPSPTSAIKIPFSIAELAAQLAEADGTDVETCIIAIIRDAHHRRFSRVNNSLTDDCAIATDDDDDDFPF